MHEKRNVTVFLAVIFTVLMAGTALAGGAFAGDKAPRMTVQELAAMIDSPDVLILDVRRDGDFKGSELMIKNAERRAYNDVDNWAKALPKDKKIVLYCA